MKIDDARNLKAEIFREVFKYEEVAGCDPSGLPTFVDPRALEADAAGATFRSPEMGVAIGFEASGETTGSNQPDVQLVVLVRDRKTGDLPIVQRLTRKAKGECRVITTGPIRSQAFPLDASRPPRMGCSVGHVRAGAGSLGCFVATEQHGKSFISNNHVLAWTNKAAKGDPILQPSKKDGGRDPEDRVGVLLEFVPIKFGAAEVNYVDAALASIFADISYSLELPEKLPGLSGRVAQPYINQPVLKVGRQTIQTEGVVMISELSQVMVEFGSGATSRTARFDNQIAVSGTGGGAFSKPGDSGAFIFDREGDGVGLLFAGSSSGGLNDRGLSFANRLDLVLNAFQAELVV